VKSNSIQAKHIGVGAVASSELRDRSVEVRDLGFPISSRTVVQDEQIDLGTEFTSLAATGVRHRARGHVGAGDTITLPAGAVGPPCSHLTTHPVGLEASASTAGSVTITTRTLAAQVLPS
jgi:hypothetical protein